MRARRSRSLLGLVLLVAAACASPPPPLPASQPTAPPARRAAPPTELERSLLELADSALDRGELDKARNRYERARAANPDSLGAQVGLSRVALRRNDYRLARLHAREALSLDRDSSRAYLLLAEIDERSGEVAAARTHLASALASDPLDYRAHAALERLSGEAPEGGDPLRRAWKHPYDPAARLAAAELLLERGQPKQAVEMLEAAVWVTDRDPVAGAQALRLLRSLDERWAERRTVAVHCRADESVRSDSAWRARLRLEWRAASESLDPALRTVFVPTSMAAVSGSGASADLTRLERAFMETAPPEPAQGLIAFFTERPPPMRRSEVRLGQAEFLGRRLFVRLEPDEIGSRTLLHELLHIYGGMHIAPDSPSILNPGGQSRVMDSLNQRIVGLVRDRRFGWGGVEVNVLPFADLEALSAAYESALRLDLELRRLGIEEALAASETSRFYAADLARDAAALDPHLADVAQFTGTLYLRQKRFLAALRLHELAAKLYGLDTPRGRQARASADAILRMGRSRRAR